MTRVRWHNSTWFARLATIGLCAALTGCAQEWTPPRPQHGERHAEVKITLSGDARNTPQDPAARHEPPRMMPAPKPPVAPRSQPRSNPVIREHIASLLPYPTEAEADEDAIAQACEVIAKKLADLDPPVHYRPSPAEVRAEFLQRDSRTVRAPSATEKDILQRAGITGERVYVEYEVEVRPDQVRELRSQDRVSSALRVLGGLFALSIAGFLFLRADEWTKGYLTSWLALAAVTLAGAAAAALIFI